jgi:hypothetical protein
MAEIIGIVSSIATLVDAVATVYSYIVEVTTHRKRKRTNHLFQQRPFSLPLEASLKTQKRAEEFEDIWNDVTGSSLTKEMSRSNNCARSGSRQRA